MLIAAQILHLIRHMNYAVYYAKILLYSYRMDKHFNSFPHRLEKYVLSDSVYAMILLPKERKGGAQCLSCWIWSGLKVVTVNGA